MIKKIKPFIATESLELKPAFPNTSSTTSKRRDGQQQNKVAQTSCTIVGHLKSHMTEQSKTEQSLSLGC
jgi:hypothetical protein